MSFAPLENPTKPIIETAEKPPLVWEHMQLPTKLAAIRLGQREGQSAREIGKRYFTSRAAITACANRNGISLKKNRLADDADLAQSNATKIKRLPGVKDSSWKRKLQFHLDKDKQQAAAERLEAGGLLAEFVRAAVGERISLVDLAEGQCRWPFEDGQGTHFCGRAVQDGSSYCTAHHARAYYEVVR